MEGETFFDEPRYLGEYEMKKPGAFAMRDELLQLAAAGRQKALATTVKTEAPGIHRMAFQVSGTMTYGSGEPQPFTRILNFEVPVGSAPDPAKAAGDEVARPKRAKARKPDKH